MTASVSCGASRWSGRLTLRQRILAVNIFAIAILAGGDLLSRQLPHAG